MRRTQPDADIHDAKNVFLKALGDVDDGQMFSCAFEDFSKHEYIEYLSLKVALVLTDPPYNTRRAAGARKSDYDKISLCVIPCIIV
jgi:DNA modification methylase